MQSENKRDTVTVIVKGEKLTLSEICEKYQLTYTAVRTRYYNGDKGEDLIKPVSTQNTVTIRGEKLTLKEVADKYRLNYRTVRSRYHRDGKRDEDLIKNKKEKF